MNTFKFLSTLLLILISLISHAQNNDKQYYSNGNLMIERIYESDCHCYRTKSYYPNGAIERRMNFIIGSFGTTYIDGEDVSYYEDGTIKHFTSWKNDIRDGRAYTNYENGQLAHVRHYKEGYKSGVWQDYDEQGILTLEVQWHDEKIKWGEKIKDGKYSYYHEGKLTHYETFVQNRSKEFVVIDTSLYAEWMKSRPSPGKRLFVQNCSRCHLKDMDDLGPSLYGIAERRSDEWIFQMIKDMSILIFKRDRQAIEIYNEYRVLHPDNTHLSDTEISMIIDYIKTLN